MINYESLLSGGLGIIIGTLLSIWLNYKIQTKLIKKEFIFKEKIKQYEKISDKISQIYEICLKAIALRREEKEETKLELPKRICASKEVINYFLMFTPPNFNYTSPTVKKILLNYKKYLEKTSEKKEYSREDVMKISQNINSFTSKIRKQMRKELKWPQN